MSKKRRIFTILIFANLFLASRAGDAEASGSQINTGVASNLAQCVGQFDAAEGYGSYIDGFSKARSRANKAMSRLIAGLKDADASVFITRAHEAQTEYEPELVRDPMNTLNGLRALMHTCGFYAEQAEKVSAEQAHQEAIAEAARAEEQKARLQAENEKRQHEYEQQRIALETEQAKAEAMRVQAQANDEQNAQQAQTVAKLQRENEELLSKVAMLEDEKNRYMAEVEAAKRTPSATQNETSKSKPAASLDVSKNHGNRSAAHADAGQRPRVTKTNLLEAAITPGSGTKASWDEFVDEGGLNHQAQFYGLPVIGANPSYTEQGKIAGFEIIISQPVSPKKLRDVLNGVCGSKADDWQFPNSNKSQGYIENSGCYVSYEQPNPEQWHVSFTAVNSESSS